MVLKRQFLKVMELSKVMKLKRPINMNTGTTVTEITIIIITIIRIIRVINMLLRVPMLPKSLLQHLKSRL